MTNRNPVKQLFITFPKSNVDKVTFRDTLLRFEPDYYMVVEEKHKDGTPHLHAVVRFKNKYSKAFVLKYFKQKYPDDYKRIDVKPVRSIKQSLAYLSKEDTHPLVSGAFEANRNPQKNYLVSQYAKWAIKYNLEFKTWDKFLAHSNMVNKLREINTPYAISLLCSETLSPSQTFLLNRFIDPNISLSKDDITFLISTFNFSLNFQ